MQVYTGKEQNTAPETSQGKQVVIDLTEGLQGRTVVCDNFFTSFSLAEELWQRKMTLVGTIRKNKPELPPILLQVRQRAVHTSLFAFHQIADLVSYIPKARKNVILLSTRHREPAVADDKKRKPQIIQDYNQWKAGVDTLDQVFIYYFC